MLVVADSSPLIVLFRIGHIEVLPKLFGSIMVPPAVAAELHADRRPLPVREFFLQRPGWLAICAPISLDTVAGLRLGESQAISLAIELGADVLLVDERRAYREAVARRLNAIGTVRVLERAAEENLLDLEDAFNRLKTADFWISHDCSTSG